MNSEQKIMMSTEALVSDNQELSDEELDAVSGGCGESVRDKLRRWKNTDGGPNILRRIFPQRGNRLPPC